MKALFPLPLSLSKLLLLSLLFVFSENTKAQDCDTPDIPIEEMKQLPWFGNPDYLPKFMDSLQNIYSNPNARVENGIIWRIPIQFWIFTQGI